MRAKLINNVTHVDSRGFFQRIFDSDSHAFENQKLQQINISDNPKQYTLRGMHFQVSGYPEHKYISVLRGEICLVVSNAHLATNKTNVKNQYFSLSENSQSTLFVPSGLATGWVSLSEDTLILYLMTSRYEECHYSGFRYDDDFADINWPALPLVVSSKDYSWSPLR